MILSNSAVLTLYLQYWFQPHYAQNIRYFITIIVNGSITSDNVPFALKRARFFILDISHYYPIAVLFFFSKILDCIISTVSCLSICHRKTSKIQIDLVSKWHITQKVRFSQLSLQDWTNVTHPWQTCLCWPFHFQHF